MANNVQNTFHRNFIDKNWQHFSSHCLHQEKKRETKEMQKKSDDSFSTNKGLYMYGFCYWINFTNMPTNYSTTWIYFCLYMTTLHYYSFEYFCEEQFIQIDTKTFLLHSRAVVLCAGALIDCHSLIGYRYRLERENSEYVEMMALSPFSKRCFQVQKLRSQLKWWWAPSFEWYALVLLFSWLSFHPSTWNNETSFNIDYSILTLPSLWHCKKDILVHIIDFKNTSMRRYYFPFFN